MGTCRSDFHTKQNSEGHQRCSEHFCAIRWRELFSAEETESKERSPIHTFRHNEKSGAVTGSDQKIPCPPLLLFACERAENLPLCAALKPTYPISFLDQNSLHDLIRLTNPAAPNLKRISRKCRKTQSTCSTCFRRISWQRSICSAEGERMSEASIDVPVFCRSLFPIDGMEAAEHGEDNAALNRIAQSVPILPPNR